MPTDDNMAENSETLYGTLGRGRVPSDDIAMYMVETRQGRNTLSFYEISHCLGSLL
jgi:hypothetical protein